MPQTILTFSLLNLPLLSQCLLHFNTNNSLVLLSFQYFSKWHINNKYIFFQLLVCTFNQVILVNDFIHIKVFISFLGNFKFELTFSPISCFQCYLHLMTINLQCKLCSIFMFTFLVFHDVLQLVSMAINIFQILCQYMRSNPYYLKFLQLNNI